MVETGRDRLTRDGSRREGVSHAGRGRRFLFQRELKVAVSLNEDLRFRRSHMARNAESFQPDNPNIDSHCASGAVSNGRLQRALCLPESTKADDIIADFLAKRRFRVEIGDVLPYGNVLF